MKRTGLSIIITLALVAGGCGGGASSSRTPTPGGGGACGGPAPSTAATSCGGATTAGPEPSAAATGSRLSAASFEGIASSGTTLGDAGAPIVIDVYQNFLCPHCANFALDILPQIITDYVKPGRAQVRFHDVALGPPQAATAHEAAECAADQGKFWPAYLALYEHLSEDEAAYTTAAIESWLSTAGIDAAAVDGCLAAGTHRGEVEASTQAFEHLGDSDAAYASALATVQAGGGPAIPLIGIGNVYLTAPASYGPVRAAIEATLTR